MRWTEARQGVRVIKFRSVLDRYETTDLTQIEAAELLGLTERTFRRWCVRFEADGGGRAAGPPAWQGVAQTGSA